jgi:hypothetical protein
MSYVFRTLSNVDIDPLLRTNDEGYKYLNWMDAHQEVISRFPDYFFEFEKSYEGLDYFLLPDGTAYVSITMTIANETIKTSLPIYKANSFELITNPNAADVHNTKLRLRTRALAEFGLGCTLYGEDAPVEASTKAKPVAKKKDGAKQDPRTAMWADVQRQTTREKAHAAATKYKAAVNGTELDDDTSSRWAALCKKQGWEVANATR